MLGEVPSSFESKISSEARAWGSARLDGSISVGQKWDSVDLKVTLKLRGMVFADGTGRQRPG